MSNHEASRISKGKAHAAHSPGLATLHGKQAILALRDRLDHTRRDLTSNLAYMSHFPLIVVATTLGALYVLGEASLLLTWVLGE